MPADIRDSEAVAELLDKGRAHLGAGEIERAETCFRKAAKRFPLPVVLNNWALTRYMRGDHNGALKIILPLLVAREPYPFTRALASLAHAALGQKTKAHELLEAAIRDFEQGLSHPASRGDVSELTWLEYTALIKRAAGELGEHRLVLDLHRRWPGRGIPEGRFAAGVAAFNLGDYEQAASYWSRIKNPRWTKLMQEYALVASLVRRGVVPPFALEYDPSFDLDEKAVRDVTAVRALVAKGAVRMRMLASIFDPSERFARDSLVVLAKQTGDWGLDLARRVFDSDQVSLNVRLAAAQILTEAGVISSHEPVKLAHHGRPLSVTIKKIKIHGPAPELDRKVEEAIRLHDLGKKEQAYRLLLDLQASGVAYPPAMLLLANLMRERGEIEQARSLLETLEAAFPEEPIVLFNLAGLWLLEGDVRRAQEYLVRINPEDLAPEFQRYLEEAKAFVKEALFLEEPLSPAELGEYFRTEIEERPISIKLPLKSAIKKIPVQWLNAAALVYETKPAARRPERETRLMKALLEPDRVSRALAVESQKVREALQFLLDKGGWCKLTILTRRYGRLDGDGYWWDEVPPSSTIGRLRLLGLVYVGRAQVDGKWHRVAVIPLELREILRDCLDKGRTRS